MASAAFTRDSISPAASPWRRGPKATFSIAVMCGNSAYCWKTVLTGLWLGGTPFIERPLMRMSPEVGSTKPAMALSSVVLPQPLGPRRAMNSPLLMLRETPAKAVTAPYRLTKRSTTTTSGVMRISRRRRSRCAVGYFPATWRFQVSVRAWRLALMASQLGMARFLTLPSAPQGMRALACSPILTCLIGGPT